MKLSTITTIMACLFIGTIVGYGVGYVLYEPKVRSYEVQVYDLISEVSKLGQSVSSLTSDVTTLNQTISSQEAQISTLSSEKSTLESEKSKLQEEKSTLQSDLIEAQVTLTSYKEQVNTLKPQVSELQTRLVKILGISVTQNYQWEYGRSTWYWDLPITLSTYVEYSEKPRPALGAYYVDIAKDPKDDSYIDQMVQKINDAALGKRFTEIQKLNFVIAFVQSLPYTVDIETTPYDEYPRYPVETLFDRGGDCEDTSILVAALLDRLGYDAALLLLKNAQHMAVGVSLAGNYGSYYEHNGKKYFYLETTGEGWQIGQIPPGIADTNAYIYPLSS